ncbi:hypothetical protein I4F81_009997 [Pyropia yezoensis]|uniref:Uncharacterized protein n=1 Tax=Pyropia yezoensis TaxID=2788 RepID=A0ACC3CBM1_PYRYE|nr:hypothetical protein I4F81_009997 [Neopyropia yezoensis]
MAGAGQVGGRVDRGAGEWRGGMNRGVVHLHAAALPFYARPAAASKVGRSPADPLPALPRARPKAAPLAAAAPPAGCRRQGTGERPPPPAFTPQGRPRRAAARAPREGSGGRGAAHSGDELSPLGLHLPLLFSVLPCPSGGDTVGGGGGVQGSASPPPAAAAVPFRGGRRARRHAAGRPPPCRFPDVTTCNKA